jgi:hypothetical protein
MLIHNPRLLQTNILNVHYHFDISQNIADYVAIFTKVDKSKVNINILTHREGPIPGLYFRIEGGIQIYLPPGTQYPKEIDYYYIYLVLQNTTKLSVIPRKIVQTWHTYSLSPKMKFTVDALLQLNPEYTYTMFDDTDARNFIKNNYNPYVLQAYDTLIPGPYKADLFRYCYLYKHGGVYIDMKIVPQVPLYTVIPTLAPMVLIDDLQPENICTTILATPAENPLYKLLIVQCVKQILKQEKGKNCWDVTGPSAFARSLNKCINKPEETPKPAQYVPNIRRLFNNYISPDYPIFICNRAMRPLFFKSYSSYYEEEYKSKSKSHHTVLWKSDTIFQKTYPPISDFELQIVDELHLLSVPEASFYGEYQTASPSPLLNLLASIDDQNILGI